MSIVLRAVNPPKRRNRKRNRKGGRKQPVALLFDQNGNRRQKKKNPRRRRSPRGAAAMRGPSSNQYFKSLIDPENNMGRIPDPSTWKSSVFQIVENFDLTTASDGAVALVFSPTPVTPTSTGFQHVITSTNTEASGAQGVWLTQTASTAVSSSAVGTNFRNWRVVSGCICAEYIGDTSTDAGTICCLPIFRGQTAPTNMTVATAAAFNQQFPLRNGCRMLYRPLDNGDLEYFGGGDAANPGISLGGVAYGMWSAAGVTAPASGSPEGERTPVAFCVFINGATASKKVARVRCVFNYEAIPLQASLGLFSTLHEPTSRSAIDFGMDFMAQLPWGEAWQGVAGTAARVGQEMAQSAFAAGTSMVGNALLNKVRSVGYRTGAARALTYDYGLD